MQQLNLWFLSVCDAKTQVQGNSLAGCQEIIGSILAFVSYLYEFSFAYYIFILIYIYNITCRSICRYIYCLFLLLKQFHLLFILNYCQYILLYNSYIFHLFCSPVLNLVVMPQVAIDYKALITTCSLLPFFCGSVALSEFRTVCQPSLSRNQLKTSDLFLAFFFF